MSFNEEKNFTREELVHALRACATMGAECEQCEFYEADTPSGYNSCHESLLLTKAADFIESIPSVKSEQKKGRWKITSIKGETWGVCSNCNFKQKAGELNFCPNCGTDMRGESCQ